MRSTDLSRQPRHWVDWLNAPNSKSYLSCQALLQHQIENLALLAQQQSAWLLTIEMRVQLPQSTPPYQHTPIERLGTKITLQGHLAQRNRAANF